MPELVVRKNQVDYVGAFTRPVFSLWGDSKALFEGHYEAFSTMNVGFKDFRIEGTAEEPASQSIKIFLGLQGHYRFKFDRVEATLFDASADDQSALALVLQTGTNWLRSSVPNFSFQSHLVRYSSHCELSEGTSKQFLLAMNTMSLTGIGENRGSGAIFHADIPELAGQLQLTVDHSLLVDDGLFVDLVLLTQQEPVDYPGLHEACDDLLRRSLATVDLAFKG